MFSTFHMLSMSSIFPLRYDTHLKQQTTTTTKGGTGPSQIVFVLVCSLSGLCLIWQNKKCHLCLLLSPTISGASFCLDSKLILVVLRSVGSPCRQNHTPSLNSIFIPTGTAHSPSLIIRRIRNH